MDKLINYEDLGSFHENLVNDSSISEKTTWSSEKITDELKNKANTAAMNTALAGKQDKLTASFGIKFYQLGNDLYIDTNGSSYNPIKHSFAINGSKSASGNYSFAEGYATDATGSYSHVEGFTSDAIGSSSHAEGSGTKAQGDISHTEGYYTISNNPCEHAEGSCNVSHTGDDSNKTIHSIGIGYAAGSASAAHRQNAEEIMKNGDIYVYGVGGYDGIHIKNEDPNITVQTLQEYISSLEARIYALEHPTTIE